MRDGTLCLPIQGSPPTHVLLGFKKQGFGVGKWGGLGGKIDKGETILQAAARELQEESGLTVSEQDLELRARLAFVFPARPTWNQLVYVFVVTSWRGELCESAEVKPTWFVVRDIPYREMWQDGIHWLPAILAGKRLQACFTFKDDNESVDEVFIEDWQAVVPGCGQTEKG
ncbi:MAG: NUDIX domain-containing protein [Anaerolineales bacterium]|nr:MAG: NUDIX domain-containing protein [Anaerolineales bacterium]